MILNLSNSNLLEIAGDADDLEFVVENVHIGTSFVFNMNRQQIEALHAELARLLATPQPGAVHE